MASHSEAELERMWDSLDQSTKRRIGTHCFMSGPNSMHESNYQKALDSAKYGVGGVLVFKNILVWVANGERGELYPYSEQEKKHVHGHYYQQ